MLYSFYYAYFWHKLCATLQHNKEKMYGKATIQQTHLVGRYYLS